GHGVEAGRREGEAAVVAEPVAAVVDALDGVADLVQLLLGPCHAVQGDVLIEHFRGEVGLVDRDAGSVARRAQSRFRQPDEALGYFGMSRYKEPSGRSVVGLVSDV